MAFWSRLLIGYILISSLAAAALCAGFQLKGGDYAERDHVAMVFATVLGVCILLVSFILIASFAVLWARVVKIRKLRDFG